MTMWHVDFSLAIYNRSGKYVIGRDLIAALSENVSQVYYWRQPRKAPPRGLAAKVLGNAEYLEHRFRSGPFVAVVPDFKSTLPMLHLDPATVLKARLRAEDMVLCHDLGPITHPSLFSASVSQLYHKAYGKIASVRPRMVFVSHTTKKIFEASYGPTTGSYVIYPPIRLDISKGEARPPVADLTRFILTVGAVGHRKNQAAAIRAFDRSGLAADGVSFVICGGREPGSDEVVELARSMPGIVMLDFVSDAELRWLYAHAIGFVLVSLLEGFGVPVAEAISRGLLPLVSKASVLEEVAGPTALGVDPLDEEDIALGLRKLVGLTAFERADRVRAAQRWIEKFSYEKFVRSWRLALLDGTEQQFRSVADELSCDNVFKIHPLQPI
jgi:glycosyltransferase involved in cell wall biosynthesis